jgi:hypothetical protein
VIEASGIAASRAKAGQIVAIGTLEGRFAERTSHVRQKEKKEKATIGKHDQQGTLRRRGELSLFTRQRSGKGVTNAIGAFAPRTQVGVVG